MTQAEISNFLQHGALFGAADGECLLFEGPWSRLDSQRASFGTEPEVGIQPFFEAQAKGFFAAEKPRCLARNQLRKALEEFLKLNTPVGFQFLAANAFEKPLLVDYEYAFSDIQQRIGTGALKKAVPVVFARKNFVTGECLSDVQKAQWLLKLMELQAHRLFPYGFWNSTGGLLGATPEVLFHKKGHSVATMALAGTLPKTEVSNRLPLANDPKEVHEHGLVVDDIVTQLQNFGEVSKGPLETIELPTLFHLKTQIELRLPIDGQVLRATDLLHVLHPTPALGVSPRGYGYQWLSQHPGQQDRGYFGGPILFRLSDAESIALVAIRNVEWNETGIKIGSGGGVVAESELHREWAELQQKREAVFKSLGM